MATKQATAHTASGVFSTSSNAHSPFAKARTMFSSACSRVNHEIGVRSAVRELEQLDEQALRDIGIQRCDIERFARYGR